MFSYFHKLCLLIFSFYFDLDQRNEDNAFTNNCSSSNKNSTNDSLSEDVSKKWDLSNVTDVKVSV